MAEELKRCRLCNRLLPPTEFYIKKCNGKEWLYAHCKKCACDANKAYEKPRNRKRPKESIDDIQKKANALGMTYGKYVAMKYCENERRNTES